MKKGFTLIELLAVIVILAIIATIATPIVLSIIEDTKESATLRNAEYYLEAVEQSIARKSLKIGGSYKPNTCIIQPDGNLMCDGEVEVIVEVKGKKPSGGTITFDKGKINDISLNIENKVITKNEKDEFVINEPNTILEPGLYDAEDNLVASWDILVNTYGMDVEKTYNGSTYKTDPASPYCVLTNNSVLSYGVKLIIPNSVETIGAVAFFQCTNLTSIVISEGLRTIGANAFQNCTNLTSIEIPDSLETIGSNPFYFCDNLSYNLYGTGKYLGNANNPYLVCAGVDSKDIAEFELHNDTKHISSNALSSCTSLESVAIPSSVTTIGDYAFSRCASLANITFNGTVEQWNAITIDDTWNYKVPATEVICSDGTVALQ